ncbi:hypothetical protein ACF3MZ_25760 [Paenibacillaceae bacterium WGS1546]|uniref:hypothetical protein n=1 Tax=Cohnella sp. WGS1546 TaxID=3366810 RepID=UPI00372D28C8
MMRTDTASSVENKIYIMKSMKILPIQMKFSVHSRCKDEIAGFSRKMLKPFITVIIPHLFENTFLYKQLFSLKVVNSMGLREREWRGANVRRKPAPRDRSFLDKIMVRYRCADCEGEDEFPLGVVIDFERLSEDGSPPVFCCQQCGGDLHPDLEEKEDTPD